MKATNQHLNTLDPTILDEWVHKMFMIVIVDYALPFDTTRIHCSGGSHGGFLVGHLITQFTRSYRSTVARNPVMNITSQFFTSDIPDWGLAVTGISRFDAICTAHALQPQNAKTLVF